MNRLLTDVHVPLAIVLELRARSIDVLTAQELGAARLPDDQLLQLAVDLDRVLLTQDKDFLSIGADWQSKGKPFRGVIFARQELAIGLIIEHVHLEMYCCTPSELQDRIVFLPLS